MCTRIPVEFCNYMYVGKTRVISTDGHRVWRYVQSFRQFQDWKDGQIDKQYRSSAAHADAR